MLQEEEQKLMEMSDEEKQKIYPTIFKCDECGIELTLNELWYWPYKNQRYCECCYTRMTNRKIYKPCHIDIQYSDVDKLDGILTKEDRRFKRA